MNIILPHKRPNGYQIPDESFDRVMESQRLKTVEIQSMPYDTDGQLVDAQQALEDLANPNVIDGMYSSPKVQRELVKLDRKQKTDALKDDLEGYRFDDFLEECDQRDDYKKALLDVKTGNDPLDAVTRMQKIMQIVEREFIDREINV